MIPVAGWMIRFWAPLVLLAVTTASALAASSPAVDNRMRGKADAPITLIEYSDFTCGYCLKFFKET